MEWLLANPQIHSTFSSLGAMHDNNYVVGEDCLVTLEEINCKLSIEDHTLRTFRRAIGFGQNIKNDIIPLLVNANDPKIIDATIRILVNLTVPVECLLSVEVMSRTDVGRHTIYELNKLLLTSKECFTDNKTTKSIIDYMKYILEKEGKLTTKLCDSINNCLLLLRNILHIPEVHLMGHHSSNNTSMQNQIVWNLFTQSVDKLLIHLMTCPQRSYWGVTMVQLIALMYKDQHVSTLQKLINIWFEPSLSESSDDNESNTSPPKQCSGDSSPMLTSDPTSDSSDNGGSSKMKSHEERRNNSGNHLQESEAMQQLSRMDVNYISSPIRIKSTNNKQNFSTIAKEQHSKMHNITIMNDGNQKSPREKKQISGPSNQSSLSQTNKMSGGGKKRECPSSQSELSDCGYGTQVENPESISTSSNEDDGPQQKPVHQKPPSNQKQRYNAVNKPRNVATVQDKKEWRRKKLVKRSRSNIINMKGLLHHTPTDEDISNILKEFTVDFLLKGYGYLVQELHAQLLLNLEVQIDTSHFFWLVTYFLKFAAQLELDLEHINTVLSFEIVSYLTFEGVSLCEQLELSIRQQDSDIKPCLRRMHLVVTAIREFLQALETYKKINHLSPEDKEYLRLLQLQISATEDLKCLFVLLLSQYKPQLQNKQYLQDIIVTNHILLLLLDDVTKFPEYRGNCKMLDHIKQFATVDIMHHYGLLLEDFYENGEYVNDCIFTMMHHIGGDLGQIAILFQPTILKTYSQIWETEYELCDDWSDLIEYVIHKFINKPQQIPLALPSPSFNIENQVTDVTPNSVRTQEESDTLYWYYLQSKKSKDVIGSIVKHFQENGHKPKTRLDIIQQLLQQDIISLMEFDDHMKYEDANYERDFKTPGASTSTTESGIEIKETELSPPSTPSDDIQVLRERLIKENKGKFIEWLQKILIECCFIKLNVSRGRMCLKDIVNESDVKIMEPVPYHYILKKQSVPLVPWNSEQREVLLYQPFMFLLHKLGLHLPVDAGKLFVRIPEFWTADILYSLAEKLGPIDKSHLKFNLNLLQGLRSQEDRSIIQDSFEHHDQTDHFAISKSKQTNSIIRFTPDITSTPSVPDWLQIVTQSKNPAEESILFGGRFYYSSIAKNDKIAEENLHPTHNLTSSPSPSSSSVKSTPLPTDDCYQRPSTSFSSLLINNLLADDQTKLDVHHEHHFHNRLYLTDDEETRQRRLQQPHQQHGDRTDEINSLIIAMNDGHDVISNCETASVASDLTRMYVSDEEDKHDISPTKCFKKGWES